MRPEVASTRREAKISACAGLTSRWRGGLLVLAVHAGLSPRRASRPSASIRGRAGSGRLHRARVQAPNDRPAPTRRLVL